MFSIPRKIHFIGIGGAGMAGLAGILHEKGYEVTGSDLRDNSAVRYLAGRGITVALGHDIKNLPACSSELLVVRSSAVNDENIEFSEALKRGIKCVLRGEMLAAVASLYRCPVAVAGSHGKTTVTAMLVHILLENGLKPGYMIGGKVNRMEFSASAGESEIFITESDESDGTQIHLHPEILLITNIEDDHSWTLGGEEVLFRNFRTIADNSRYVIYGNTEAALSLLKDHDAAVCLDYNEKNEIEALLSGWEPFQLENALLAVNGAIKLNISKENAVKALQSFPGVERRMTVRYRDNSTVLIEDYAHHPTEVKAVLSSLRQKYSDYSLKVLFQPHRYARLAKYINEFAEVLRSADKVIVIPVFAAWVEDGAVNGGTLAERIGSKAVYTEDNEDAVSELIKDSDGRKEIIAVLGAGDVDMMIPALIKKIEEQNEEK